MKMLTQGDIERMIVSLCDALEDETYAYSDLSDKAAETEADYKYEAARIVVALSADGHKMTALERQARVDLKCADQFRAWKIAEARRQASKEALQSIRARLDATRTLSANVRHQT